jgi:hypothetical protein
MRLTIDQWQIYLALGVDDVEPAIGIEVGCATDNGKGVCED